MLPYAELALLLGMTGDAVKMAVHRLRKRNGELLLAEVADTVASPQEAEDEIRHLIAVPSFNDGATEVTKTFKGTPSGATGGAVLGLRRTTTITIVDNDPGAGFGLSSQSVWEGVGAANVTIARGNDGNLNPCTVDHTTADGSARAGEDCTAVSGRLDFLENETVKCLVIPILPDQATENLETFQRSAQSFTSPITALETRSASRRSHGRRAPRRTG